MRSLLLPYFPLWAVFANFAISFALDAVGHAPTIESRSTPWSSRNFATIQKIYNLTVYPNNMPILQHGSSAVPAGLFSEQAAGRVSPVGNFSGFDDSIEYFFALAPDPNNPPGVAIYSADIVSFTSGCVDVAASLVYLRTGTVAPKTAALNATDSTTILSQVCYPTVRIITMEILIWPTQRYRWPFWDFDSVGAVLRYEAWIPNLQAWTKAGLGIDYGDLLTAKATVLKICPIIQDRCQGANQQYADELDCIVELEEKPFGSWDEAWGDNVACRIMHLVLTQIRPDVHCPHVGPKGGSGPSDYKCVDIDYSKDYFDDVQLFGAPEGDVFTCDGPLVA